LVVHGSAGGNGDGLSIDISVAVEVRCNFEIHNAKLHMDSSALDDRLKKLVTVTVGSADIPPVLRLGERVSAVLRVQTSSIAAARFDLPVTLDFGIPDTAGGYHSFSISKNATIEIPSEKRIVDVLFKLDETNCVKKLEWRNPIGITQPKDELRKPNVSFVVQSVRQVETPSTDRVDVLVGSSIWSAVQASVTQYATDLGTRYSVYVYSVTYGTPDQVRTFLQGQLTLGLKGTVLVGDIPFAMYYIPPHDVWDTAAFPCDLFYMDLNGVWADTNGDGTYESHTGDLAPEIWVGRIKPTGMGDQATLINGYFNRDHAYRTGAMSVPKRALVYVDDDWDYMADGVDANMRKIYADTTKVNDKATTTATDYMTRLSQGYEWVHLQCHGWSGGHSFKIPPDSWDGTVYSADYTSLDPQVLFYQFFVCSGARFSENNYLAGVSVFKTSYGLLSIGSTKTGSMLYFEDFYTLVATTGDIGTAFRTWFVNYGESSRDWFYGLTIIGDPALQPQTLVTATVTLTQTSTLYTYRTTTTTATSYTSTTTSTSTIPTVTTVVLVPLTVTSTIQSTQYVTSTYTTTTTSYTDTSTSTSTIPTTVALLPSTVTSTVQNTQYLTSILTTTVTSYAGTEASTSTIVVPTTVALVPFTATSTVPSTQYVSSTVTTTVTSYTDTQSLTSTIPAVTTVVLLPSTVTSTVQNTQYLTSMLSTTVTSYTSTSTATSTSVVYTTVTVSPGGQGFSMPSSFIYLGFVSLLAMTVSGRATARKRWRIPEIRSSTERRCSRS
jgi:hypothetical protein